MRREHAPGDPETRAGDARLRPGPEGRLEEDGAARAAEPGAGQSGTACGARGLQRRGPEPGTAPALRFTDFLDSCSLFCFTVFHWTLVISFLLLTLV